MQYTEVKGLLSFLEVNPSDVYDGTLFLSSARGRLDLGLDSLEEIEAAMIKNQQDKK